MKIAYLIYCRSKGLGGHYRSLSSLLDNWGRNYNTQFNIVHYGTIISPVLKKYPNVKLIKSSFWLLPEIVSSLRYFKVNQPEIIHSYDSYSYFIGRIVSFIFNIPIIYTKCGGSNESYAPKCKYSILFSKENFNYLSKKNDRVHYYLIPNRINIPAKDMQVLQEFKKMSASYNYTQIVTRIGNITAYYKKSIEAAFLFTRELNKNNCSQNLLLIVGKQLDSTLEAISNKYKDILFVLADDSKYTVEANKMIYISDYIIGTGRGAMEAISLKKNVYISTYNSNIPVKVTSDNFLKFLDYNFSERSIISDSINLDTYYSPSSNDIKLTNYFNEYCLAEKGNEKIYKLYSNIMRIKKSRRVFFTSDFIINLYKYFRANLSLVKIQE